MRCVCMTLSAFSGIANERLSARLGSTEHFWFRSVNVGATLNAVSVDVSAPPRDFITPRVHIQVDGTSDEISHGMSD